MNGLWNTYIFHWENRKGKLRQYVNIMIVFFVSEANSSAVSVVVLKRLLVFRVITITWVFISPPLLKRAFRAEVTKLKDLGKCLNLWIDI